MSPTPSITNKSFFSSSSSSINTPSPPSTTNTRCPPSSPTSYPPPTPGRRAYLLIRAVSTIVALIQITSVAVAFSLLSRRRWLDPCLSPAITSLIYSSIEIFSVLYWHCRAHHLTRAIYDGIISVGFAVAVGFFTKLALPSIQGVDGSGWEGAGVLGGLILICMLSQIIIHASVSVQGVRDTMKIRREKKEAQDENLAV